MLFLAVLPVISNFAMPPAGASHETCLRSVASALEVSGEGIGDIASATVTACIPAERVVDADSAFARLSPKTQNELMRASRDQWRADTLLHLLRLRACRKTLGCDINTLP
jgi:hypothetical protein